MTVVTMDTNAALASMGQLYGKTNQGKFEESWRRFRQAHAHTFLAYKRASDRDRWALYDSMKREWADANPELAADFYCTAAGRITKELGI